MGKRRTHPPARAERTIASAWRPDRRQLIRLGYLTLALLALIVFAQIHYIVPDSAAHIAYARSLLWDRDVDFYNDYRRLGMIDREEGIEFGAVVKETRKPGNPFGVGSAICSVVGRIPNSGVLVLPRTMRPARLYRATSSLSSLDT